MLSPRWKKVLHDLRQNRSRTVFVVASVAVGVYAVSVILGGRGILLREFDRGYEDSQPAAMTIYTRGFDSTQIAPIQDMSGVDKLESRTNLRARYSLDERPADTAAGWSAMDIEALYDFERQGANRITPVNVTSWPPRMGEIVIEQSALTVEDIAIGDVITVETPAGTRATLRVSGFAWDINAMPAPYVNRLAGYIDPSTLAMLDTPQVFTKLMVRSDIVDPTRADYEELADRVRDRLEAAGVTVLFTQVPAPGSHFLGDVFKAIALLLLALGVLALFLSGFLVINTISALMSQHTKQIGIMKAIGGRADQISWMYLVMVIVLGIGALAVGIPVGAWSGQGLVDYAAEAMNFRVESVIPPVWPMVIAVTVGLLVPVLSALFPITRGAKTPIVRALNPGMAESAKFGHGLVDRVLGSIHGLPRPVALSLRNTFVRKGRLAMTLATLVLACAVVMAVVSIRSSINDTVDVYSQHWDYDIRIDFDTTQALPPLYRSIERAGGATESEAWTVSGVALTRADGSTNEGVQIFGVPATTDYYSPDITSGRWLREGSVGEVVINGDVSSDDPEIAVGTVLEMAAKGTSREFTVVGISTSSFDGPAVYVSDADWISWAGETDTGDRLFIRTQAQSPEQIERVAKTLETRLNEERYPVAEVVMLHEVTQTFSAQMDILLMFLFIMAGVLGAVGVIGLSGAMMINVIESTREIGVMRAIGAGNGSIFSIFITESVVVAFIAWVGGAILSWPLSSWLTAALAEAVGFPLYYRFSVVGIFVTLGLVLGIAVLASLLPAWRASLVSVRDAIAYE